MSYEVIQSGTFLDSVISRQGDEFRDQVWTALGELQKQPFKNPKLQTHEIGKARNGKVVYTSYVGGARSDRRLVWQLFNRSIVLLLYGTHAVQERVKRMRIDYTGDEGVVTIYELVPDGSSETQYHVHRTSAGKLFMAWTNDELASYGFPEPTIEVLRHLNSDTEFLALEDQLGPELFEIAFNLLTGDVALVEEEPVLAEEPEATDDDRAMELALRDPVRGALFQRVEPEYLKEILSQPIEDWMIFLHPDQRVAVERNYKGPARVRGAAGTGKTVVGLHRAAWLAAQNREIPEAKPVLFTTFISSLPPIFESLYMRMPNVDYDEVMFINVDRLASQVCRNAGERLTTNVAQVDKAFTAAWDAVATEDSALLRAGFSRGYVRDEITYVIKGRDLRYLDEYLELSRTGRKARMNAAERSEVWQLRQLWDREMRTRGTVDFADVVLRARDVARQLDEPEYSSVIIDEAQDLTLVGLQFLRALVSGSDGLDRPNALMILGDGAQRLYTGGFTLKQAGVNVTGRSTVLRVNYRNTSEIIEAARQVGSGQEVEDFEERFTRDAETVVAQRHGPRPFLVECDSDEKSVRAIAAHVARMQDKGDLLLGDVGVLVPTNRMVSEVITQLEANGVDAQNLMDYEGQSTDQVKVGTYHRGKGLEFKVVFLPGVTEGQFPRSPRSGTETTEEELERYDQNIAQLFVAMTRARDSLVVLYVKEPSSVLVPHLDSFELVSPEQFSTAEL